LRVRTNRCNMGRGRAAEDSSPAAPALMDRRCRAQDCDPCFEWQAWAAQWSPVNQSNEFVRCGQGTVMAWMDMTQQRHGHE